MRHPNTRVISAQGLSLTKVSLAGGLITGMSSEHAARLKKARARKDITQTQLARAAGISQGTIGNIESGIRGFGASVVKLATVLDVSPQWLATGDGEMTTTSDGEKSVMRVTHPPANLLNIEEYIPNAVRVTASFIKVAGMAKLEENGYFQAMDIEHPAASGSVSALSEDPNAYALCISGDAGFPAIRDGEYIVLEPNLEPLPTDRVVIALRDGRTMLQELIASKPDSITTVCLNGTGRRTILREDIRAEFGIQTVTNIVSPRKWARAT